MIYTYIPYNPRNNPGNLGWTYKNFMKHIHDEEDWVCFLDHDACFTTHKWYSQLEDIIEKYPNYGLFSCMTNRIGQKYQIPEEVDPNNHDMKYHRNIGKKLQEELYDKVTNLNNVGNSFLSGHVILIKKKTWNIIKGCPDGQLGVDNEIHRRCIINHIPVGRMDGVYVYHWYRADTDEHIKNAMTHHPNAFGRN